MLIQNKYAILKAQIVYFGVQMPGNLYRIDVTSLLDDETSDVLKRWEADIASNSVPSVTHEALVEAFRERKSLSSMLQIVRENLNNIDPAMFPYLLPYQKEALRRQLVRAHYLYAVQARIDEIELRWDGLKSDRTQCALYEKLLNQLRYPPVEEIQDKTLQLECVGEEYVKPFSLFGMTVLAPILATSMIDLCAGKTSAIKNLLIDVDKKDVYLGWSRALILSILNLIPEAFVYDQNAANIRDIAPVMSFLNIFVVNTCLGIELYLLLKNTFAGAWATRNQSLKVNPWEQFTTQLRQRKFVLLNWLFLSLMHLSAFLCLIGVLNIWPWGPFFSVGLRIIQIIIISARYDQDLTAHRANLFRINNQILQLNQKRRHLVSNAAHSLDSALKDKLQMEIKIIEVEMDSLRLTSKTMDKDWQLKEGELKRQAFFTTFFFIGVMMFSFLIFPPAIIAPPIGLAVGLAGAAICFASVLILSKVRADMAMERTRAQMLSAHFKKFEKKTVMDEQLNGYMLNFIQLKSQPLSLERNMEMKQLYLKMSQLVCRSKAQSQILERQKIELVLMLARDILIPIAVLSMFLFIPTGVGFGVVAGLILMHIFIKKMIDVYYPVQEKTLKFDEAMYQKFSDDPSTDNLFHEEKLLNRHRFYQPVQRQSEDQKKSAIDRNAEDDYISDFNFGA
jgi:hypothetical protein